MTNLPEPMTCQSIVLGITHVIVVTCGFLYLMNERMFMVFEPEVADHWVIIDAD